ncbi:MAG: hypothetical protein M1827_004951 [Pycnora praestabilis]|nr:MAG: hypothetical protein M1827_004951 [Pycnora praestabilis]
MEHPGPNTEPYGGLDRSGGIAYGLLAANPDDEEPSLTEDDGSDAADTESVDSHPHSSPAGSPSHSSKRKRLKAKMKKVFHIQGDKPEADKTCSIPILADAPDPPPEEPGGGALDWTKHNLKDLIHHPVDKIKSTIQDEVGQQIATNMVATEIAHGEQVKLVQAQDGVLHAETAKERALAIEKRDDLVRLRQDMFVRWTMDRHVKQVRRLPDNTTTHRGRKDFLTKNEGGTQSMDWTTYANYLVQYYSEQYGTRYIGYCGSPPPASEETFVPVMERLIVASAPFQKLIMTARRICRWDNPNETLIYLSAYLILWACNYLLRGAFLVGLALVIHRRLRPPSIEDLRRDIAATEDMAVTALTLTDYIAKRGDANWVNPLVEELGPWILLQIGDVANGLEVLRNFYEWRSPRRTTISLGILTTGSMIAIFTPTWLLVKCATLIIAILLFGLYPVASKYPDYRLLASPIKWVFWNIPTHAEWAIDNLQKQAAKHNKASENDAKIKSDDLSSRHSKDTGDDSQARQPNPSHKPVADVRVYHFMDGKHPGELSLSSDIIRCKTLVRHAEAWEMPYKSIKCVEKRTRSKKAGGADLRFVNLNDEEFLVKDLEKRDELFTQIIGLSDIQWQVVW